MNKIESALANLFEKHRLVFWYDEAAALRPEYEALNLQGVEKLELNQNAFGLKYRLLRQEPKTKFLIYHAGPEPKQQENWLLDLQLANAVFTADRAALWLAELGLGLAFKPMLAEYKAFFQAETRLEALKERLNSEDTQSQVRLKMMAVCLGSTVEPHLESILMVLLAELADQKAEKYTGLQKFGLLPHLWKELESAFAYRSQAPHIEDFALKLFESAYRATTGLQAGMNTEALNLLNRWQDSAQKQASYDVLARNYEKVLDIPSQLIKRPSKELLKSDTFKGIDHRILESLQENLLNESLTPEDCQAIIRQRATTHWFTGEIAAMYHALEKASSLLALIRNSKFVMHGFKEGFTRYTTEWFHLDQLYRNYYFYVRQSKESTFFSNLNEMVEKHYTHNFLWVLNNNWQLVVDANENWKDLPVMLQREFFQNHVLGLLQNRSKVAVVISDALRYEVAEELEQRVTKAGRFTTNLSFMAGMLPSYTALGMAALLPNKTLGIQADGNVLVDGISSAGLDNRNKVLAAAVPGEAKAMLANDFKGLTREEQRAAFRDNQVLYLYHNQIDMVGDKRESEDQTVEAVETTLNELVELIKMLRSANFSKILVTADHGFLYQYQKLDEADQVGTEISGKEIILKKRRFVIGKNLEYADQKLKALTAEQLGLVGDYEIALAKSINRLKLSGAGMQFVHGGSSLQEIVIPVLAVNMVRGEENEARLVEVSKLESASNTITTGQLAVSLLQLEPISAKTLPRTLRLGLFAEDGTQISNTKSLYFGFESENQRDRELKETLVLTTDWQKYNRQTVWLRLDELIPNTDKYHNFLKWSYTLNRTQFADIF